jgi:hypothetical protein
MLQDNFGVESRHTRQGSLLTFDCPTIAKLQSQLNNKIRVSRDTVTPVTAYREVGTSNYDVNIENKSVDPPFQEPSHPSLPSPEVEIKPPIIETCEHCGYTENPFWMKMHRCDTKNLNNGR